MDATVLADVPPRRIPSLPPLSGLGFDLSPCRSGKAPRMAPPRKAKITNSSQKTPPPPPFGRKVLGKIPPLPFPFAQTPGTTKGLSLSKSSRIWQDTVRLHSVRMSSNAPRSLSISKMRQIRLRERNGNITWPIKVRNTTCTGKRRILPAAISVSSNSTSVEIYVLKPMLSATSTKCLTSLPDSFITKRGRNGFWENTSKYSSINRSILSKNGASECRISCTFGIKGPINEPNTAWNILSLVRK